MESPGRDLEKPDLEPDEVRDEKGSGQGSFVEADEADVADQRRPVEDAVAGQPAGTSTSSLEVPREDALEQSLLVEDDEGYDR